MDLATDKPVEDCVAPTEPYVPPEPVEIVLHEAEHVLMVVPSFEEGGDTYLVPAYRFRGEQETVVDAVAVDDDSLVPPPQPPVTTRPPRIDPGLGLTSTTSACLPVEPGPDGAVPDICMLPPETTVEEPQP